MANHNGVDFESRLFFTADKPNVLKFTRLSIDAMTGV